MANRSFVSFCFTTVRDSPRKMQQLRQRDPVEWVIQVCVKFEEERARLGSQREVGEGMSEQELHDAPGLRGKEYGEPTHGVKAVTMEELLGRDLNLERAIRESDAYNTLALTPFYHDLLLPRRPATGGVPSPPPAVNIFGCVLHASRILPPNTAAIVAPCNCPPAEEGKPRSHNCVVLVRYKSSDLVKE